MKGLDDDFANVKIINLTPHIVKIYDPDGKEVIREFPPSGKVARVNTVRTTVDVVSGISVRKTTFGKVESLPPATFSPIYYIVSFITFQACLTEGRNTTDLLIPDTSPEGAVRDKDGMLLGVKGFQVL